MKTIIYCNKILTPSQRLENYSIVIENGFISKLTPGKEEASAGDEIIEEEKLLVTPGLVDIHVHGALGFDANDATEEANINIARFLSTHGVTSYCATTYSGTKQNLIASIQTITKTSWPSNGARQIGLHMEGPFLCSKFCGAQPKSVLRNASIEEIIEWKDAGQIKLITLAPERPGSLEAIRFCAQNSITTVVGHSEATYDQMISAADAGLSQSTHTFNGMPPLHHRNPGVIGAVLTDDRIYAQIIPDGIHLHPAIVKLVVNAKTPNRTIIITDAIRAAGLADGFSDLGGQLLTIKDGAPYLQSGSLAGSMLTMDTAVRNVMNFTGLPFNVVLPMATSTPASSIGLQDKIGTLKSGTYADIVFWDDQFRIVKTMISGQWAYKSRH
jgi:N-acetylglucosamine-6-phosphate deacetylase